MIAEYPRAHGSGRASRLVRRRWGLLRSAQQGGVSIEYGLLGAVIALGLVASLVSTRSTLNSTLNTISSQVGSATSSQSAAPVVTPTITPFPSQFWGSKALSTTTKSWNGNSYNYTFTYADGSQAQFVKLSGQTSAYQLAITDRTNSQIRYEYFDTNGNSTYVQVNQYNSAMSVIQSVQYSSNPDGSAMAGNPPVGSNSVTQQYDAAGNATGSVSGVGAIYNTVSSNADGEAAYFKALSP